MEKDKRSYTQPKMNVVEIQQNVAILQSSPGGGSGNLSPTINDNDDNDW